MPLIGNTVPQRPATAQSGEANATSKVHLEDDTYEGTIVAILFFHEDKRDEEGNLVASDPSLLNTVRVKVLVGEDTLSKKMAASTFKNANFAKFLAAATGNKVEDEAALKAIDTDDLIGKPIRVLTCYNDGSGYTNIAQFLAPRKKAAPAAA